MTRGGGAERWEAGWLVVALGVGLGMGVLDRSAVWCLADEEESAEGDERGDDVGAEPDEPGDDTVLGCGGWGADGRGGGGDVPTAGTKGVLRFSL